MRSGLGPAKSTELRRITAQIELFDADKRDIRNGSFIWSTSIRSAEHVTSRRGGRDQARRTLEHDGIRSAWKSVACRGQWSGSACAQIWRSLPPTNRNAHARSRNVIRDASDSRAIPERCGFETSRSKNFEREPRSISLGCPPGRVAPTKVSHAIPDRIERKNVPELSPVLRALDREVTLTKDLPARDGKNQDGKNQTANRIGIEKNPVSRFNRTIICNCFFFILPFRVVSAFRD